MSNKIQRFSIDLERNEEAARLAADVEPGARLNATLSVVSKDDKTLVVELEEIEEPAETEDDDDEVPETETGTEGLSPAMKVVTGGG